MGLKRRKKPVSLELRVVSSENMGTLKSTGQLKSQLDELERRPDLQLVFTKPISKRSIRRAETELGISFPDAYVDFVTTHGTFHFQGLDEDGRHIGRAFNELLPPERIVSDTRAWKKELLSINKTGSEIATEVLENFVVFFHDGGCNVAVFCPAKTFQGKMAVYMVYYDSLYVEWPAPSLTFETFLSEVEC